MSKPFFRNRENTRPKRPVLAPDDYKRRRRERRIDRTASLESQVRAWADTRKALEPLLLSNSESTLFPLAPIE